MKQKEHHLPASEIPWYNPLTWLRSMYAWVMNWAEHPAAVKALAILSAVEAIFFPIPVDPLLIAMGTARPKRAMWYATVGTVFSVGGGLVGYWLGFAFWEASKELFFTYVFSEATFGLVMEQFNRNAFLAIFLASFTPIPYKVFTLAAGVAHLDILPFIAGAVLGRGGRYYIIGALLHFFGPTIRTFIDKYLEKISIVTGLVLVAALVIYRLSQ